MWSIETLGTDVYHLVACFCVYSMLGWLVESIYMSFCNKKITNRGFGITPFCPIYGFGAVAGYLALSPLSNNPLLLYIVGALGATVFEYIVGKVMIKIFHEVWWDYSMKPFNFQGILCLESTLAWGLYAIIVVRFLHDFVLTRIDLVPRFIGVRMCLIILFIYSIDFLYHMLMALEFNVRKYIERAQDLLQSLYR